MAHPASFSFNARKAIRSIANWMILVSIAGIIIAFLGSLVVTGFDNNQISGDLAAMKEATNPRDFAYRALSLQNQMDENGITSGHAALIYYNNGNDMSVIYSDVKGLYTQAAILSDKPAGSVEVNTGMLALQRQANALQLNAFYFMWIHSWWLGATGLFVILLLISIAAYNWI